MIIGYADAVGLKPGELVLSSLNTFPGFVSITNGVGASSRSLADAARVEFYGGNGSTDTITLEMPLAGGLLGAGSEAGVNFYAALGFAIGDDWTAAITPVDGSGGGSGTYVLEHRPYAFADRAAIAYDGNPGIVQVAATLLIDVTPTDGAGVFTIGRLFAGRYIKIDRTRPAQADRVVDPTRIASQTWQQFAIQDEGARAIERTLGDLTLEEAQQLSRVLRLSGRTLELVLWPDPTNPDTAVYGFLEQDPIIAMDGRERYSATLRLLETL